MYAREVDGRTLTLSVSGMLWGKSLVMKDQETGSLWSHLLGEAMQGPLVGKTLDPLPSVMTDWETWKAKYPQTSVVTLDRTAKGFRRGMYAKPKAYAIGYVEGEQARHWRFDQLAAHPVVNDALGETDLLVLFAAEAGTAFVFNRELDGQLLTFQEQDGKLMDAETGSEWDRLHARAVAGSLKGKNLSPLPGAISTLHAWTAFHPESEAWKPDGDTGSR